MHRALQLLYKKHQAH